MFRKVFLPVLYAMAILPLHAQDVRRGKFECLKGRAGNSPITMFLCSGAGHDLASYYVVDIGYPMALFRMNDSSQAIRLFGKGDEFAMNAVAGGYTGTMKSDEPARDCAFDLKTVHVPHALDVYAIRSLKKIDPNQQKGASYKYSISTIWPRGGGPRSEFIARHIGTLIGMKYDGKTSLKSFMRRSADMVPKDLRDVYDRETSIESQVQVFVSDFTNDFLSLTVWDYSYSGGAHGFSTERFSNLDLKDLRVLCFEDVFRQGSEKALLPLLEQAFRFDKKLKPEEPLTEGGLFSDHIMEASHDILLSGKGVVFHYGLYEIAPYSEGMVDLYLPWSAVKGQLTTRFSARLAKGL